MTRGRVFRSPRAPLERTRTYARRWCGRYSRRLVVTATINGYLGVAEYDMSNYGRAEVEERHVFQLEAAVNSPTEPWDHLEEQPSGGGPAVRFRLSWLHLDDPGLHLEAGHGALLERVRRPAA